MQNAHPSDLEKLVPAGIKITVGKDTLTLFPLKVGQLPDRKSTRLNSSHST